MLGVGLSIPAIAMRRSGAGQFALDAPASAIRAAILDPASFASGGWRLPGPAGARLSASARASVAMQRRRDDLLGPELVSNGGFDSDTVWTKGAGWSISGGVAVGVSASSNLLQTFTPLNPVGKTYRLVLNVPVLSSGTLAPQMAGSVFNISSAGTHTFLLAPTANDGNIYLSAANFTGTIDNVSVREVIVPALGWEFAPHNGITDSNDFGAWLTTNAGTLTTGQADPLGGTTATLFSGAGKNVFEQFAGLPAGRLVTASVWMRSPTVPGTVNLGSANGGTIVPVAVGTAWQRYEVPFTSVSTSDGPAILLTGTLSSVVLFGGQLNLGPTPTAYIPTTTTAVYGPAIDWLSGIGAYGLASWEARTNVLLWSASKTNAAWLKTANASVSAGTFPCPVSGSAEQLVTTVGSQGTYQLVTGTNSQAWSTFVLFRPPPAGNRIYFGLNNQNESAVFYIGYETNTQTSAVFADTGGWTNKSWSVTPVGSTGWLLGVVTATSPSAGTTQVGQFIRLELAGSVAIGHSQLEQGAFATSPILTYGSAATRAADAINAVGIAAGSAGTLIVDAFVAQNTGGVQGLASLNAGSNANRIDMRGNGNALVDASGVSQASLNVVAITAGSVQRYAIAYALNDFAFVKGGGAPSTDASGTVPVTDRLTLGDVDGGGIAPLNGWILRPRFATRRLPNAQLQALTA